ncbi:MAG: hypothetical protein L0H83_12290 [Salinisphaera sp.]|nr:hypothetical protein [Salinisphaera sp.]
MMRVPMLLSLCLLAACVRVPAGVQIQPVLSQARGEEQNQKLYTDLIRQMIEDDKLYAALAHIEAQEKKFGTTPGVRLLRAQVLRKLGRTVEAEGLYRRLLNAGQLRGQAHHGLGLIYVQQNLALALQHLQTAAALLPTNAAIRNDYGFALLKEGQVDDARIQLATAYQLEDGAALARNNYVLVLLVAGEEGQARRVARQSGIGPDTLADLRRQAQMLRGPTPATGVTPPPRPTAVAATAPATRATPPAVAVEAPRTGAAPSPRPASVAVQAPRMGGGGG